MRQFKHKHVMILPESSLSNLKHDLNKCPALITLKQPRFKYVFIRVVIEYNPGDKLAFSTGKTRLGLFCCECENLVSSVEITEVKK